MSEINHFYIRRILASSGLYIFFALICGLSFFALVKYPGQSGYYVLFTVVSNALLYFGFRKNAIYFDTFIGIFFWLGFWLKLTCRVAFMDGQFHEAVGNFDGSGAAFDRALLATFVGFLGLLAVSFFREKYLFVYPQKTSDAVEEGLLSAYRKHRKVVLAGFAFLVIFVGATNLYYGIYQRGAIPRTVPHYGLGGIYSWLLLFGLASISALILHFEFSLKKKAAYTVVILSLVEQFVSNVSMLSRGMILNVSALGYGALRYFKLHSIGPGIRFLIVTLSLFLVLSASSVILVEHFRSTDPGRWQSLNIVAISQKANVLFLDRWVGIEGVMAASTYPTPGWDLWNEAWKELYSGEMSFYDAHLITSPYRATDFAKHHFVSLPGILAFCFYPGSLAFLEVAPEIKTGI